MIQEKDLPEIAAKVIEYYADRLFGSASAVFAGLSNRIKLRVKSGFSRYLSSATQRYSQTKTLVFPESPQYLYDFYVPIDLQREEDVLASPCLRDLLGVSNHIVITGTGGSGKSTFMRHLLLDAAKTRKKIPIYIELREFNSRDPDLLGLLLAKLDLHKINLSPKYIQKAMERGYFVFLLDGFDELSREKVSPVQKTILVAADRYDACGFVVSSRPDESFRSWERFCELKTAPLSLDKAVAVIRKINFANDTKPRFIKDLRKRLFREHQSFLSNPLLLTIMFLAYRDHADVPSKLHLFYTQAFDSLYGRHDAMKPGGFKRELQAALAQDDFEKVFAAFSVLSYGDRRLEFTGEEVRDYLEKAAQITGISFDPAKYLADLLRAVCMLYRDGLRYRYTHRSFQEYFAARFVAHSPRQVQEKLLHKLLGRVEHDSVLRLLVEMDQAVVEDLVLEPLLERIKTATKYRGRVNRTNYVRFISIVFSQIGIVDGNIYLSLRERGVLEVIRVMYEVYGWEPPRARPAKGGEDVKAEIAAEGTADAFGEAQMPIEKLLKHPRIIDWLWSGSWWPAEALEFLMRLLSDIRGRRKARSESISKMLLGEG